MSSAPPTSHPADTDSSGKDEGTIPHSYFRFEHEEPYVDQIEDQAAGKGEPFLTYHKNGIKAAVRAGLLAMIKNGNNVAL